MPSNARSGTAASRGRAGKAAPRPAAKRKSAAPAKARPTPAPKPVQDMAALAKGARTAAAGQRVHVLQVPFEERAFAAKYGATWDGELRQHLYRGAKLPRQLADYAAPRYSLEAWLMDEINGYTRPAPVDTTQMKPREHQAQAIRAIRAAAEQGWRGYILADEPGLGKTLAALVGMNEVAKVRGFTPDRPAKLLILCPKSVIPHWRETIDAAQRYTTRLRPMVLNYDQALKLLAKPAAAASAKTRKTANRRTAVAGSPTVQWDLIIGDESHKLKNASQRSAIFGQIARSADGVEQAPFVLYASATIGQNPLELRYLAPLYGQLTRRRGLTAKTWGSYLESQGYHVQQGKLDWSWVKTTSKMTPEQQQGVLLAQREDVSRMAKVLFTPASPAIRRSPADIAGWPEINRQQFPVALEPEARQLYEEAWQSFRREMALQPRGVNPKSQLVIRLRFQQKASLLLVPTTVDYIEDMVEQGYQVAVSTQFIETIDALKAALAARKIGAAEFSGRPGLDREAERLTFQLGRVPVILFTVTEGISLQALQQLPLNRTASANPRVTIVQDTFYSAIQSTQVEGRAHRDGQNSNVYYMYAEGTVQKPILDIMMNRLRNMRQLSGDKNVEELEGEDLDTLNQIDQLLLTYEEPTG